MAWLLKENHQWVHLVVLVLIAAITVYLLLYHGYWLHHYLTWPLLAK